MVLNSSAGDSAPRTVGRDVAELEIVAGMIASAVALLPCKRARRRVAPVCWQHVWTDVSPLRKVVYKWRTTGARALLVTNTDE